MAEVEDVLHAADLRELDDVTDRVVTERMLTGEAAWPIPTCLPLKRWDEDDLEVGYVRREAGVGAALPLVFTDASPVRSRGYATIGQLLDAGWRAD